MTLVEFLDAHFIGCAILAAIVCGCVVEIVLASK